MGEDMLDMLTKGDGGWRNSGFGIDEPGFPQTLPDIACPTTMDGHISLTADIDINKVALTDLEGLEFDREFRDTTLTEGLTGFHQRTG